MKISTGKETGIPEEAIGTLNSSFKHVVGNTIGLIKMRLELSNSIKAENIVYLQQQTQFFLNNQLEAMKNKKGPSYINKNAVRALCRRILTENLSSIEVMESIIETYLSIVK